jgi:hypothetical protein
MNLIYIYHLNENHASLWILFLQISSDNLDTMQYIGLLCFFMLETGLICWLADNLKTQVRPCVFSII